MQIDQLIPIDGMASALETGRRKLASLNLDTIQESAISAARSALPEAWSRPKRRRRWPIVGVILAIGTAILGLLYVTSAFRRESAAQRSTDEFRRADGQLDLDPNPEMIEDPWTVHSVVPLAENEVLIG